MFEDDEDDGFFQGAYEDGHWEWDDDSNILKFVSNTDYQSVADSILIPATITDRVEFKDDLDAIEQQRFRKRMQRKNEGSEDVVTLQGHKICLGEGHTLTFYSGTQTKSWAKDIKDIVMYTAPLAILNRTVINLMHTPNTNRLLRALIFYSQYYIQIADEMAKRTLDLEIKIPTKNSLDIENCFRENLQDIRSLIAKEYSAFLLGRADIQGSQYKRKLHKLGNNMTRKTRNEAFIFEAFICLSTQIVFVALGRKWYNYIDPELNRLFRSKTYNISKHRANGFVSKMSPEESKVLYGTCVHADKKLLCTSPLINELHCDRHVDYRLLGLGVIEYPHLDIRLKYFQQILTEDERQFEALRITLGIIGLKRSRFDTMLKEIPEVCPQNRLSTTSLKFSSSRSIRSCTSSRKSTAARVKTTAGIIVPDKSKEVDLPVNFPETSARASPNDVQCTKWLRRVTLLRSKLEEKYLMARKR